MSATYHNTYNANNYLGWSTSGGALPFAINGIGNKLMLLTTGGLFGVGTNFTPTYKLDIDAGDINLNTSTNAYRLGGNKILWHNNITSNIYVGVSAGSSSTNASNIQNTFVGNSAGTATTASQNNVAIGYQALFQNHDANNNVAVGSGAMHELINPVGGESENTAVGFNALYNTKAYGGCALGYMAGYNNTTGCRLVAIGENAALNNTTGNSNMAIGEAALLWNKRFEGNIGIGFTALQQLGFTCPTCSTISSNVAVGNGALYNTDPTSVSNGIYNTALGDNVFYSNTTGSNNTGMGYQAGYSTITGIDNVCIGVQAGYTSTLSYKTYVGFKAGYLATGDYNTFVGYLAGTAVTTGLSNTFMGLDAGYAVTTSSSNSGLGMQVLAQTTTGASNTGLGYKAGFANTTGSNNTFVGYQADANAGTYTNCGAFGNGVTTTASNKIVIGNASVTWVGTGGTSTWQTTSDGRFKINVQENVSGLDFIKRLRPVTYNMNTQAVDAFINQNRQPSVDSLGVVIASPVDDFSASTNVVHSGFIAQEVEQASQACGFTSSIVHAPANANDPYSLGYAEFVVPLVKAVQQLDSSNTALKSQVEELQSIVASCCNAGNRQSNHGANGEESNSSSIDVELMNARSIILNQNVPNPFKEQTIISYFIPDNAKNVKIIFTDSRGNILKEVSIPERGKGQLNVYAQDLSSGIYTYNIVVDGVTIDSKKMVCTK